jgi:type IV pilus assembly protein PilE
MHVYLKKGGFTLIELMVVVAIVAILASIAVPAFTEQMRTSRRSDAFQILGDLQLRQERFRANNASYATMTQLTGAESHTLPSGYYVVTTSEPTGNCASGVLADENNSFVFIATANGVQAADTRCATISLSSLCGVVSKTSTPAGGTCWR